MKHIPSSGLAFWGRKITLLLVMVLPFSIFGQPIGKVEVIGANLVAKQLIETTSGLRVGENFAPAMLDDAIRKIYALRYFDDVAIRAQQSEDKVNIEIEVKEFPQISEILFEGAKKIKEKDLLEKIDIKLNDFLSPAKTWSSVKKIKEAYTKEGLPSAEISTEAKETNPGRVSVKFVIKEGSPTKVKDIAFHGNQAFTEGKLRKQMKNKERCWYKFRSGKFSEEDYKDDLESIESFYHNNGYIMAKVTDDSVKTDLTGKRLSIAIWVEEGTKYRFGKLGIGGYTIYDSAAVWEKLKFKQGEIFSTEKLDESMSEIYFLFQEKGYIYAQVEDDRRVEGDSVNLNLSITEGKEAHIRKIEIVGNSRTFDKVIRREMAIYPGNTFVRSKLMRSVRNIYYLNYFGDVIPDFKVLENGDVDLVIAVEEKPIGKFQIGATYNSRDKLVGNISVGWPNVLGRGWETEFTWEFGKLRTNFSISFTEPWFLDVPTSVGFDIYSSELQSTGYYTELRQGASVRLGRRLSWPDDYFSLYWRYKLEQLKYYDFSSTYTPTTSYDLRTMSWPRIESGTTVTLGRDSRDSQMFATKGSKNLYALEVAGDYIGGDVAFQKQDFRSDWYFPLHKYLTFVIKGRAGYLTNAFGDDPEYVPYGERFFFGNFSNDGQIRGYQDRAISPIDTSDAIFDSNSTPDIAGNYPMTTPQQTFQIGGRVMGILTAELRVPIVRDQLYFSVFGDVGNMWRDAESIDFSLLKKGAGVGIRIVVPMLGVMGLDVGYGFDTDDRTAKKSGLQWHFQIGTE